jgi:hypothetical protein
MFLRYKCKAIPETGREGPWGCETLKIPHFLENRFTDGSKVVSPRTGRVLHPGRSMVLISVRCWFDPRAIVRLEGWKINDLIGNWTQVLLACSLVSQPTTLLRDPMFHSYLELIYQISCFFRHRWRIVTHLLPKNIACLDSNPSKYDYPNNV